LLGVVKTLSEIVEELRVYAAVVEAECFDGRDAARLARVSADGAKVLDALTLLFAKRAVATGSWIHGTQATRAEQWYSEIAGVSEFQAARDLQTAERLDDCVATEAKLRDGTLSLEQAQQVTKGAAADPDAETKLLDVAETSGFRALREEQERTVAAATDMERARAKAHRERHVRTWVDGAATRGSFSGPTDEVNRFLKALGPFERARFSEGRQANERDNHDAYRFDALVRMADCAGVVGSDAPKRSKTRDVTRIRVDLSALVRGATESGEVCEIPGVGPVPVSVARDVLRHGLMELVITDGVDVQTVVSRTRHVPEALKIAIAERDHRCKVRGCDRTDHLQRHHTTPFADGGLTTYEGLGAACPDHHHLIHDKGYEIVVNDDGTWSLRAPPDQAAA
jgi:hypothetical protein